MYPLFGPDKLNKIKSGHGSNQDMVQIRKIPIIKLSNIGIPGNILVIFWVALGCGTLRVCFNLGIHISKAIDPEIPSGK